MKGKVISVIWGVVLFAGIQSAYAITTGDEWGFSTFSPNGAISGSAGETIGWGYSISNNDPNLWLAVTVLSTNVFEMGVTNPYIFDCPVIAPNANISVPYIMGKQGLYEIRWDAGVPVGFSNFGNFTLSAEFYNGNPYEGGNYALNAIDKYAPYKATVTAGSIAPEPSSACLVIVGLLALAVMTTINRRRYCSDQGMPD